MFRFFVLPILFLLMLPLGSVPAAPSTAKAEINRAKPTPTPKRRKRYIHPCPPGTEQYGAGPPVSDRVYCRQPMVGGYRPHGTAVRWFGNGPKRNEGDFIRGKKHGVWKTYHRDGRLKSMTTYYNGKRREKIIFDREGKPVQKGSDKKGRRSKSYKRFYWNSLQKR